MNSKYVIIILFLVVVFSCKNESKKENDERIEIQEMSLIENEQLKLNNGEKWIANNETHEGVKNMDSIIKAFKTAKIRDYGLLGGTLSLQTSYIIEQCDMKGEPHDQLHVVLVPMLDDIAVLKDADINKSKLALENLEGLIKIYFNHFKL